ncbi:DUF1853 family protein [Kushneria phosphatilytica]|uniref:DUF1853 family protein n=1 Tax=Kushneria phosphatilytica TaxID=657387 RepID=A0A1S1NXA7_9GAMM|nr:DUF1853 family protein [Kushneria phosphatilytica]OHV12886.1 hypothetical protein BH688_02395 [Kushneria phosphatilytica]QEL10744.1 DUF1853 family protein [Kushneria phosphatilytica]
MSAETIRHPLLRDLAWLIETPPLLQSRLPGAPDRTTLGLGDTSLYRYWLNTLAQEIATLEQYVGTGQPIRLGTHVERLWQIILDRAPATHLLAHNLRVICDQRTVGEFDLLYDDYEQATPVHMEAAIKFYLGLPEGPGTSTAQSRWIGTSGPDSLALKHLHLLTHQTRLGQKAASREVLKEFGAPPLRCRMALKGVLFYPWRSGLDAVNGASHLPTLTGMPAPEGAHPDHPAGIWLHWRDWFHFIDTLQLTGAAQLQRPHWLALPPRETLLFPESLLPELRQRQQERGLPVQLVVCSDQLPQLRVMLVDDAWPLQIPLPPRRSPGPRRRRVQLSPWPR